jgi:Flp pilus assembly protein TadG
MSGNIKSRPHREARQNTRISRRLKSTWIQTVTHPRRQGVVAVQVVVILMALLGCAAFAVDMGYMWNVRADLQRTADAAALASAGQLAELEEPAEQARQAAEEYVQHNAVVNQEVALAVGDVQLGRASLEEDQYVFEEVDDDEFPDAVRVRIDTTRNFYFAQVFGRHDKTVSASATALLVPRDIVIVADLSASHNDDSELGSYRDTDINLWDVWHALPGGADSVGSLYSEDDLGGLDADDDQVAGPGWGYMRHLQWGEEDVSDEYNPLADAGLTRLSRYGNGADDWNSAHLRSYLENLTLDGGAQYTDEEIDEILDTGHHSSSSRYRRQVAVALGLAVWNSGKDGGAWEQMGLPHWQGGDEDDRVDSNELIWIENFFNEPGDRWLDYISWATSSYTRMASANSNFSASFGPKTFTNYLLEQRWAYNQTPELAVTPHQPMQAVKDAVEILIDVVNSFENDDQLALDIYGYTARHQVTLRSRPHLEDITTGPDGLSNMQAGHFDGWTNTGGGLEYGIQTLTDEPARPAAHKMIVLLTDGQANITPDGEWPHGSWSDQQDILEESRHYVLDQAQQAADLGIRIFAVSVGVYADTDLMDEVAAITNGEHLRATSSDIAEYTEQLEDIFIRLGGKRPVELIH